MEKVAEPIKISLAAARVNARKTQAQLAEEMEISRMTLANLENGKTQISKAQLHLFCELCNIPVANIFLPYKFSEWKQLSIRGGERVKVIFLIAGIITIFVQIKNLNEIRREIKHIKEVPDLIVYGIRDRKDDYWLFIALLNLLMSSFLVLEDACFSFKSWYI